MTEVLTYATEEQADSDLERTFDKNNEVIGELERRFGELKDVSKHKADGEQYEVDCVLELRKIAGNYTCEGGIRNDFEVTFSEHAATLEPKYYKTLEDLTTDIKRSLSYGEVFELFGVYGINVNPLFYTVIKPETFDEEEREMIIGDICEAIKEVENEEEKKKAEAILEMFQNPVTVEGLSASEIAEFVRLYDCE